MSFSRRELLKRTTALVVLSRLTWLDGAIRFLVGNLQDLTAFLAYSTRAGWRAARYSGVAHGHKEFKGYWHA